MDAAQGGCSVSGWRMFAGAVAMFDTVALFNFIAWVCETEGMLKARAPPEPAGGTALIVVLIMLANVVAVWRLVNVEDWR